MRSLLLLLLLGSAAHAAAQPVQLAPPAGASGPSGPGATTVVEDRSWKMCEVTASLLTTAPGKSLTADETSGFVYLGESLDVEADVTIPLANGVALVHAKARLRAAVATDEGVTYFVSSDGILRSTIGFNHPEVGKDQFRSELLVISDEGTRLHEIFAMPDLGLRVVMVVKARPVRGREERTAWEMAATPAGVGEFRRFRVEALLRDSKDVGQGERMSPLEKASLQAMDGRSTSLSLTRFSLDGQAGRPLGLPGAPSVRFIPVPGVTTLSRDDIGAVATVPADPRFERRVLDLQRSMTFEKTLDLGRKLPGQIDVPGTPRKISAKKKAKYQEMQKQKEIHDFIEERAKSLPDEAEAPAGYEREELVLTLTPLRATRESLQLEIRVNGRLKLPDEETFTAVDATTVEQVRFGETLEMGIAELVREEPPRYDYVLRITLEP